MTSRRDGGRGDLVQSAAGQQGVSLTPCPVAPVIEALAEAEGVPVAEILERAIAIYDKAT